MSWFRRNVRAGSWCGLLALTLQLVLSFGHVHGPALASAIGRSVADPSTAVRSASDASRTVVDRFEIETGKPSGPALPIGFGFNDCPICALIQLVDAAVPADAPPLWTPIASVFIQLAPTEAAFSFAAPPHAIFQARAPPPADDFPFRA
jgi:hypothetical protein